MKLAILGLTALGLVAAACAALLVQALRAGGSASGRGGTDSQTVLVLMASQPMGAMNVVEPSMVIAKDLPRNSAPPGYITDPAMIMGHVLAAPMVEGQAFTQACFAGETSGSHLAANLPRGKRALAVSVTDYGGLEGLLYPGCDVDVLLTLKPSDGSGNETQRGAISTTLLEDVKVLAIDEKTLVAGSGDPAAKTVDNNSRRTSSSRRITLEVDPRQAKALQLAMDQGTLSLSLRNPMDGVSTNLDTVSMRQILGESEAVTDKTSPTTHSGNDATSPWEMRVIRGDKVEIESFSGSESHGNTPTRNESVVAKP
jgi:pilus assembly protein CpaB